MFWKAQKFLLVGLGVHSNIHEHFLTFHILEIEKNKENLIKIRLKSFKNINNP